MASLDILETSRLNLQEKLDATKTQAEKNKLGQFATPTVLAADILNYAKVILPINGKIRFLDPAFGTGSFYSALFRTFLASRISQASGYENDEFYGQRSAQFWNKTSLNLHIADFTTATPPLLDREKANLLICNPPYVRHHHLDSHEKLRLQKLSKQNAGVSLSGLAGLYCYFLCISHAWMAKNGIAGWLIPSEFMDVNYGQEIKKYLLTKVTLLRIHRFNPTNVQFKDALVSSAVVWIKNSGPPKDHAVVFSYGGTLTEPETSKRLSVQELCNSTKWTRFPQSSNDIKPFLKQLKLSDLFEIKRGLATGSNNFFVLTMDKIVKYQIPSSFLKPILPSPRHMPVDEIKADSSGNPILNQKLFLLSCNLPEEEIRIRHVLLWEYLQLGIKEGIKERYLCKHRSPWYSQEERPPAPLLSTYMGRQDGGKRRPFRFILNNSEATAANAYLMLYPKIILMKLIKKNPGLLPQIWQALNAISLNVITREGRIYGGGLHKIEPRELANVSADCLLAILPIDISKDKEIIHG